MVGSSNLSGRANFSYRDNVSRGSGFQLSAVRLPNPFGISGRADLSTSMLSAAHRLQRAEEAAPNLRLLSPEQIVREIKRLEAQMYEHARNLGFEEAAKIRDTIKTMKQLELGLIPGEGGADSGRGGRGAA